MSLGQHTFRITDIRRAVRAVRESGLKVVRVTIDRRGRIDVTTSDLTAQQGRVPKAKAIQPEQVEATA